MRNSVDKFTSVT